jgi:hypothetical protein
VRGLRHVQSAAASNSWLPKSKAFDRKTGALGGAITKLTGPAGFETRASSLLSLTKVDGS